MSALAKALAILEAVAARQEAGLSFSEIVTRTGAPKATAHRLLKELVGLGLLTFDPETGRYRGSLKLAALGAAVTAGFDLRLHVRPHLLALHAQTGHTCHLGVRHGEEGVYLDKVESGDYGIKLFSAVGKRFPLHCTALGKALLAFMDDHEARRLLSRLLPALTDRTITDPQALLAELAEVRKQGFAVDREEITRGLMCVAAPIRGMRGEVLAALSATFPSYIYADRGLEAEIEAVTRHAAAASGKTRERNDKE